MSTILAALMQEAPKPLWSGGPSSISSHQAGPQETTFDQTLQQAVERAPERPNQQGREAQAEIDSRRDHRANPTEDVESPEESPAREEIFADVTSADEMTAYESSPKDSQQSEMPEYINPEPVAQQVDEVSIEPATEPRSTQPGIVMNIPESPDVSTVPVQARSNVQTVVSTQEVKPQVSNQLRDNAGELPVPQETQTQAAERVATQQAADPISANPKIGRAPSHAPQTESAREASPPLVQPDIGQRSIAAPQRTAASAAVDTIAPNASIADDRDSSADNPSAKGDLPGLRSRNVQVEKTDQPQSPATARAVQVESTIRLDNAAAATASTTEQAGPRVAQPTSPASPLHAQTMAGRPEFGQSPFSTAHQQPIDEPPLAGNIVRGLSAMVNQRGGAMTMRLDPPELGAMRVQMTIVHGIVTAEFQPSTQQAHALLDRNMATLRSALESQGLTVERLVVHANHAGSQQFTRDDQSNQNNFSQTRHEHDAAGGESRGRHQHDAPNRFMREVEFESLFNSDAVQTFSDAFAVSAST